MKTIHKYSVEVADEVVVQMPMNARVMCLRAVGSGWIDIYAMVLDTSPLVERQFAIRGTGHPLNPDTLNYASLDMENYVGTVFGDPFVWHVFAR